MIWMCPLKFICRNLIANVMQISEAFRRSLNHEGRVIMDGIKDFIEKCEEVGLLHFALLPCNDRMFMHFCPFQPFQTVFLTVWYWGEKIFIFLSLAHVHKTCINIFIPTLLIIKVRKQEKNTNILTNRTKNAKTYILKYFTAAKEFYANI